MKSFLIKLVNRYTLTYLIIFLISVTAVIFIRGLQDTLFENALVLILLPGILLTTPLDMYIEGVLNMTLYQCIALVLVTFFSAFIWSLPVWGILYIVQRLRKTNTV